MPDKMPEILLPKYRDTYPDILEIALGLLERLGDTKYTHFPSSKWVHEFELTGDRGNILLQQQAGGKTRITLDPRGPGTHDGADRHIFRFWESGDLKWHRQSWAWPRHEPKSVHSELAAAADIRRRSITLFVEGRPVLTRDIDREKQRTVISFPSNPDKLSQLYPLGYHFGVILVRNNDGILEEVRSIDRLEAALHIDTVVSVEHLGQLEEFEGIDSLISRGRSAVREWLKRIGEERGNSPGEKVKS